MFSFPCNLYYLWIIYRLRIMKNTTPRNKKIYKCISLSQGSASCGPQNKSGPLFIFVSPGTKAWFYIFRWLKRRNFMTHEKYLKLPVSVFINKVLLKSWRGVYFCPLSTAAFPVQYQNSVIAVDAMGHHGILSQPDHAHSLNSLWPHGL